MKLLCPFLFSIFNAYDKIIRYLVTASEGSKYVKVWKIDIPMNGVSTKPNVEGTEVRELQLLRDHTDYLSTFCVYSDTIYSSCSDGKVYAHTFPKVNSRVLKIHRVLQVVVFCDKTLTHKTFVQRSNGCHKCGIPHLCNCSVLMAM